MKKLYKAFFATFALPFCLSGQTGGPGQPEFMQFQQAGTSNLVNPASGTFSYQIPLFSIGGYPMNLTYQSGAMMEDVASMVGWNWNLNAGCINRTMRFLPDDFMGDPIIKEFSVAPNMTFGGKFSADLEIAGLPNLPKLPESLGLTVGAEVGLFYNTHKGWGAEFGTNGNFSLSLGGAGPSASLGLGASVNSQGGVDQYITPGLGYKLSTGGNSALAMKLGKTWSVNSTEGQKSSLNMSMSMVEKTTVEKKGIDAEGNKTDHEADYASASLMGFSHNSYLNNSFQPDVEHPFMNISGTYSGTTGSDFYYVDPSYRATGYFSIQTLATKSQQFKGYGMMYEHQVGNQGQVIMDFNREKRLPFFMGETPNLPIPFRTPDVFNLSAQGLSMSFSLNINDVGVVGDPAGLTSASGNNIGVEGNFGNLFKAGANLGVTSSYQQIGRLEQSKFGFVTLPQDVHSDQLFRRTYFKNLGETGKFSHSAFKPMGGFSPVQFALLDESHAGSHFVGHPAFKGEVINEMQPVRQSNIEYLTAYEASVAGLDKKLHYQEFEQPGIVQTADYYNNPQMPYRKAHHITEIIVTQPDGMKYVFGIPVYDIMHKEVSFNASGLVKIPEKNVVRYNSSLDGKGNFNGDNSISNNRGTDHFFEATSTPGYATQYLITAVLSSNYRDLTGDGISEDDPGNYVKFNYYKVAPPYHWRTPVGEDTATFNAGLRSDPDDDRGSYVYGQKELWYLESIESKTEKAEFTYGDRKDGFGVLDENGKVNKGLPLKCLEKVTVYSLPDRQNNAQNAVPVKTIHFFQDYSLCKGIENGELSTTGKLTLKEVQITYADSKKGMHSPYIFEYGKMWDGTIVNPDYAIRDVNRWGYYEPNGADNHSDIDPTKGLSKIDYPYASQDRDTMDKYAYAWNLTGITIPGGGKLEVRYEAHDYGHVQNKVAGQMFPLAGISSTAQRETGDYRLYDEFQDWGPFIENPQLRNRIYFKLNKPITNPNPSEARAELEQDYIRDIKDGFLYYKCLVKLTKEPKSYEYVSGYAKVKNYGVLGDQNHAFIDLEPMRLDDEKPNGEVSPILKNAVQYMRINCNGLVFQNDGKPKSFPEFMGSLGGAFAQMVRQLRSFYDGANKFCLKKEYCREVDLAKSFIRLYSPEQFKLAGGSRVDTVLINDQWDDMVGNTQFGKAAEGKSYTTHYQYTTEATDLLHGTKKLISSGVADYEPLIGGDDISLKQPIFFVDEKKKAPDTEYYVETPYNESLFPSANITYSKVTEISNPQAAKIGNELVEVGRTGKIVHEFYTALDFPVIVGNTPVELRRDKTDYAPVQNPFLAIDQKHDYAMVSQGFSIELNNMSGQPKATWVYNENGDRISGEETEYYASNVGLPVITRAGQLIRDTLGLSVLYTIDGRDSYDQSTSASLMANFNTALAGPVPIPFFLPLFSMMTEEKQFRSLAVNKLIHHNAIVKSHTVHSQSASITTENLAFDQITGEPLLTKTTNEFSDTLFSFKYPAWWMYKGMGPAYHNSKLFVANNNIQSVGQFLKPGDELRAYFRLPSNMPARIWVKDPKASTVDKIFMKDDGSPVTTIGYSVYIVYNSGAKNLLSSSAGQVVTWNWNPILHGSKLDFGTKGILNSSVITYYDGAMLYCDSCKASGNPTQWNHYLSGKKGNWTPEISRFHLAERTASALPNGQTNIRSEGLFKTYNDFWTVPPTITEGWDSVPQNWEWKEKVNLTDVNGQTLETEDRIGRKTANLLGYRGNLVIAQAVNAGYGEVHFEGFEDYLYSFCPWGRVGDAYPAVLYDQNGTKLKRVKLSNGGLRIVEGESHTGKYSLEITTPITFTIDPPQPCDGTITLNPTTDAGTNWVPGTQVGQPAMPGGINLVANPVEASPNAAVPAWNPAIQVNSEPPCIKCIGGWNPKHQKEYIFSAWVKVDKQEKPIITCADASVVISVEGSPTVITMRSEGPMIDDWQRIEGRFTTPASSNKVSITLKKGLARTYFDDLRIFPADGNMASYVYDDVKLRLTYILDENNYFKKYEYNGQGELIRIKQETEEGIVTVKESASGLAKQ